MESSFGSQSAMRSHRRRAFGSADIRFPKITNPEPYAQVFGEGGLHHKVLNSIARVKALSIAEKLQFKPSPYV